jgi:hypothetical protein
VEENIRLAAVILQAVAIIVTAGFAIAGLHSWRRQTLGKRKVEVAEETLVIAHKIRNAIAYARLPVHGPEEGRTRPQRGDDGAFQKVRNSYFVPVERLRAYDDDFAKLERQRLLCETYFGAEAGKPLIELADVRRRILAAARGLLSLPVARPLNDREVASVDRWEALIWDYGEQSDELAAAVDRAVEEVEAICKPHLGG